MESNFNNRDFEQFVKQSTDQYRMYPSEKVWKGVHYALHGRRRRYYALGLALLLFTSGAVTWIMLTPNNSKQAVVQPVAENQTASVAVNKTEERPNILNPKTVKSKNRIVIPFAVNSDEQNDYLAENELMISTQAISSESLAQPIEANRPVLASNTPSIITRTVPVTNTRIISAPVQQPVKTDQAGKTEVVEDNNIATSTIINNTVAQNESSIPQEENKIGSQEENKIETKPTYPLTIESVVNLYQRNKKRLSLEVYFTPTISYRRLTENKSFLAANRNTGPGYLYVPDVETAVNHKPDMGLNLGISAGYPISKRFKLTAGVQFNVSKYDIQATYTPTEQATIALNTGYWGGNTVKANTNFRNYTGARENWLRNLYFSASLPIGIDYVIKGSHRQPGFGLAATIQPIYMIDNSAYLLSTDYKNYAVVPSLVNKWNVGTSIEAYAGYNTGNLRWKVGPQVRYNLGSSFQKTYPVREQLFDFGLKVGVMLRH